MMIFVSDGCCGRSVGNVIGATASVAVCAGWLGLTAIKVGLWRTGTSSTPILTLETVSNSLTLALFLRWRDKVFSFLGPLYGGVERLQLIGKR